MHDAPQGPKGNPVRIRNSTRCCESVVPAGTKLPRRKPLVDDREGAGGADESEDLPRRRDRCLRGSGGIGMPAVCRSDTLHPAGAAPPDGIFRIGRTRRRSSPAQLRIPSAATVDRILHQNTPCKKPSACCSRRSCRSAPATPTRTSSVPNRNPTPSPSWSGPRLPGSSSARTTTRAPTAS